MSFESSPTPSFRVPSKTLTGRQDWSRCRRIRIPDAFGFRLTPVLSAQKRALRGYPRFQTGGDEDIIQGLVLLFLVGLPGLGHQIMDFRSWSVCLRYCGHEIYILRQSSPAREIRSPTLRRVDCRCRHRRDL
ncbi:hypothetical protein M405DRAFT_187584 [Rhizopogon salebrosus TDB-379]|nr:hypothetical protein M405DRAFT_187584 [Rhizopogon salebrosus TDB-379]